MKYLVVLLVLAGVATFVYWRLRPYIRAARRFLAAVRAAQGAAPRPQDLPRRGGASGGKLVRCANCGTWAAATNAVTLRATGVAYCSHACLERAADSPRPARKSAS